MPRRRTVSLSLNHERWLVSYSDFVTLLFAFFVVMYSISQVNESKYRVLSDTLEDAFSSQQRSITPIQVGDPVLEANPAVITAPDPDVGEFTGDGAFERTADLPQLSEGLNEQFADLIDEDLVQVNSNEFWLQIDISSSVLFESGRATPNLQAQAIFDEIAQMLKGFDNPVQVEGFTDNVPINTPQFPSNWELSAARASAIVKMLMEGDVAPERLSAVGYGEYRPISDNSSEAGRWQNRRVALMISRERIIRPRVEKLSNIEERVRGTEVERTQPFPQPGEALENSAQETGANAEASELASDVIEQRLDSLLSTEGSPSTSTLSDILEADADPETDADGTAAADAGGTVTRPPARVGNIQPVELEGGGLLFSRDPPAKDK